LEIGGIRNMHHSLRGWWILQYNTITFTLILESFIIVNSRFLKRPQKWGGGNQISNRRLSKTKLIGSGSDSESRTGKHWLSAESQGIHASLRNYGRMLVSELVNVRTNRWICWSPWRGFCGRWEVFGDLHYITLNRCIMVQWI